MIFCLLLSLRIGKVWADALITISHHFQKSLDAAMESYIVQLNFSAVFDRLSHTDHLFKLKSIGVGGSVLSIWTEFLSDCRERVVVDGAVSEWILIVSGAPQGCVLGPLLFILHTSKCSSCLRTDYLPMQMTPHYRQLFVSQQTDMLLLSPLTGTWLGFRSGAITSA